MVRNPAGGWWGGAALNSKPGKPVHILLQEYDGLESEPCVKVFFVPLDMICYNPGFVLVKQKC